MGKVEKIVVLGVLFVIVSILAVSLDRGLGGGPDEAAGGGAAIASGSRVATPDFQRSASRDRRERGRRIPNADTGTPSGAGTILAGVSTALLSAEVQISGAGSGSDPTAPTEPEEGWDLVTLEGLKAHPFDSQLMVYIASAGDDFVNLSERLYGDALHSQLLRCNNEGILEIEEGQEICVPVAGDSTGEQMYEVASGDSLWKIAERIYGKGEMLDIIYEANREVLSSPDALQPGQMLRVPLLPE